jgi:hypothetical protein
MLRHLHLIEPHPPAGRPAKVIQLEARRQARRAPGLPQPTRPPWGA